MLFRSLAYTDAKFTKDFFVEAVNLKGRRAARAPEFSGNLAFDYTRPFNDSLELGLSGNVAYSGKYFANNGSLTDFVQSAYATVDGTISIGAPGGKWKLALIATNITDKIFVNTAGPRPFLAGRNGIGTPGTPTFVPPGDDIVNTVNRGRQVFIQGSVRF